ncbi:MAG: DNA adenine methylase [Rhizobiales bacterium]|nr:DNA adenine methylase [Hyphomicrobiales bacterium]
MPEANPRPLQPQGKDSFALHPVAAAKPVAPYIGGKKQLAGELAARIEKTPHLLYGEVFAGMAGVFFRRRLAPKVEVLNDVSRDVATLFRVLQNHYQAFLDMLRWQLSSRDEFARLNAQDPDRLTDLQRAARFLYVQRLSFGGKVVSRSFGASMTAGARFDIGKLEPILAAAHERLAGVWIECLPWQEFLARWDRPGALFYLDPPYSGSEYYYGRDVFDAAQHAELVEHLRRLKGNFLLTISDTQHIRSIFAGFRQEPAMVTYTAGGAERVRRAGELIISNARAAAV